jgi:hypothetical protein
MLTVEQIRESLPIHLKNAATQSLTDMVNTMATDIDAAEAIRETFIGNTNVLKEGRFKVEDYANACAYVSYRLMGYNNRESYMRAFPQRYQSMVVRGLTEKEISANVSMYNQNKMVGLMMEQSLIPTWVMNRDAFQEAIRTQVSLMSDLKVSAMVRMQAANSILMHVKPPEKKQIELNINTSETSGMDELRNTLQALATKQIELIEGGVSTREIAHQKLKRVSDQAEEADMIDVTPTEITEKMRASA